MISGSRPSGIRILREPTIPGYLAVKDLSSERTNTLMDLDVCSCNAQLFKQLSLEMKAKMQALFPAL